MNVHLDIKCNGPSINMRIEVRFLLIFIWIYSFATGHILIFEKHFALLYIWPVAGNLKKKKNKRKNVLESLIISKDSKLHTSILDKDRKTPIGFCVKLKGQGHSDITITSLPLQRLLTVSVLYCGIMKKEESCCIKKCKLAFTFIVTQLEFLFSASNICDAPQP